jgi:hypothetical protein
MEPQQSADQHADEAAAATLPAASRAVEKLTPQQGGQPCSTCGGQARSSVSNSFAPSFVYATGRVEPRFPTIGVEKELAQVIGRAETQGLTDRQAMHDVLQQHRYLARELCWVFTIQGLETYILQPRDPADFALLVESLRREPSPLDMDVVIGVRGPIAPPEMCNGLMIPIVLFDQLYSFDRNALLSAIPRPEGMAEEKFQPASDEVLDRITQISDNAGATDEHRALNYLVVRYPGVYALAAEQFGRNASLTSVEVNPSTLSSTRRIVDVIFTFTHRATDVADKRYVRVDVTEKFPFLVTRMSPYFDR